MTFERIFLYLQPYLEELAQFLKENIFEKFLDRYSKNVAYFQIRFLKILIDSFQSKIC